MMYPEYQMKLADRTIKEMVIDFKGEDLELIKETLSAKLYAMDISVSEELLDVTSKHIQQGHEVSLIA